jgi:hypothetical protein
MRTRFGAVIAAVALAGLSTAAFGGVASGGSALVAPTVTPAGGPPGSTFLVSGTGCDVVIEPTDVSATAIFNEVQVQVLFATGTVSQTVLASGSGGSWEATFTVPAGEPAGPRVVKASCIPLVAAPTAAGADTSEVGALQAAVPYPDVTYTVTEVAAQAVEAQPRTAG